MNRTKPGATQARPIARYKKPWDRKSQDKKRLAERRSRRQPFVYFFRCQNFMKIGWTTDPGHRLSSIRMAGPHDVAQVALMLGGERQERALHIAFQALWHRAEWFRDEGLLAELVALISNLEPEEARFVAGEWFLGAFGKTSLLSEEGRTKTGSGATESSAYGSNINSLAR